MPGSERTVESFPLSPLQQGMLFSSLARRDSGVNVAQIVCTLDESIDVDGFREAWRSTMCRITVLRTSFRWRGLPQPVQNVHEETELNFRILDWSQLSSEARERELEIFLTHDRQQGFDLNVPPGFRVTVAKCDTSRYQCIWSFHHILLDGHSYPLVLHEVFSRYDASRAHADPELKEFLSYRTYIDWLGAQQWNEAESYWRALLRGFNVPPTLRNVRLNDVRSPEFKRARQSVAVSAEQSASLSAFAAKLRVTVETLVQGAWALALSAASNQDKVIFGSTRACRNSGLQNSESIIGTMINTLPVPVSIEADISVANWLKNIRRQQIAVRAHEHSPLPAVMSWSDLKGGDQALESFIVFEIASLNETMRRLGSGNERRFFKVYSGAGQPYYLQVYLEPSLQLSISYDANLFNNTFMTAVATAVELMLEQMQVQADTPVIQLRDLARERCGQQWLSSSRNCLDQPGESASCNPRSTASETQRAVATIWKDLLGVEQVGEDDDFFGLGGHSLLVLRAISRINQRFQTDLSPAALFENPTLRAFCGMIDPQLRASDTGSSTQTTGASGRTTEAVTRNIDLAALRARITVSTPRAGGDRPYRMRESWICKHILGPLYRFDRDKLRDLIQSLILRLEGGEYFTVTLRKLYAKYYSLQVGDYSAKCFDVDRMQRNTSVGRYTSIYPSVIIRNADHPRNSISTHAFFYHRAFGFTKGYDLPRMEIEIGNDVWIGHNATILYPTRKIGDGAVIAAGSVVIGDVPPYAVVGGYPATVLRYRFSPDTIQELLKSRWWESSLEQLEALKDEFAKPLEGESIR